MRLYLFILLLIVMNIYLLIILRHEVHMFQQNSYMYSRYTRWFLKINNKMVFKKGIVLIIAIPIISLGYQTLAYICILAYLLLLILLHEQKKEKKKLVYTNRVKRLFFVIFILMFLNSLYLLASYYDVFVRIDIYMSIAVILISLPQLLVMIANAIIKPLETLIYYRYIVDGKKIISEHKNLKVVGITGSYGKTSTKCILNEILKLKYDVLMTPESYNTTLGVVRTIRERLTPVHEIFIVEMGAKKIHDIEEICDIVKPSFGIVTSIGPQHLETFKTIENVIKTKLELYQAIPSYGIGFVNKDDENVVANLSKELRKYLFYSLKTEDSDYYMYDVSIDQGSTTFFIKTPDGTSQRFTTKLLGSHNLYNLLSAISCANTLGMSLEEISQRVSELKQITHRLELKQMDEKTLILDDAYNSNPKGADEALNVLKTFEDRTKILITPGMIELGDKQKELNRAFGVKAAGACDYIILVGQKQTLPIYNGLVSAKFDMDKCFVCDTLDEALLKMEEMKKERNIILFENDLPDIYM